MLAAALLIGHACGQATLPDVPPVVSLLTPGKQTVEILTIAFSDDILALQARVLEVTNSKPAWYLELYEQTPPGEWLPYDARLGISEAEYQRLRTARRNVTVTGCSTMTLKTIAAVPGQVYLSGGLGLEGLGGVSFRPASGGVYWVNTRIGTAGAQRAYLTQEDDPLGSRVGYTWTLGARRDSQPENQFAKLNFSQDQTGRFVLEYQLQERRDGQDVRNVHVVVRTANCQP